MIRALIFDFDGLILDTETTDLQSWQETYLEYGRTDVRETAFGGSDHWTLARKPTRQVRALVLIMLTGGLVLFTVALLLWLPILQDAAAVYY